MAIQKTNALRQLERAGVVYETHEYDAGDGHIDGVSVADKVGLPHQSVFKTLVTQGGKGYCVFVIPVAAELDLKAAARAAGEKSVAMLKVADLERVTGYIRGGCSPVGMKKLFPTFVDESATGLATMVVSAGKIGLQMELAPGDLLRLINGKTAALIMG